MTQLEIVFQIISHAGEAKSCYMEAMELAEQGLYDEASACLDKGNEVFTKAHKIHFQLIEKEANEDTIEFSLLLLHAEDQLMSAETINIMAEKFMLLYKRIERGTYET